MVTFRQDIQTQYTKNSSHGTRSVNKSYFTLLYFGLFYCLHIYGHKQKRVLPQGTTFSYYVFQGSLKPDKGQIVAF
jgi:hypothetical protein